MGVHFSTLMETYSIVFSMEGVDLNLLYRGLQVFIPRETKIPRGYKFFPGIGALMLFPIKAYNTCDFPKGDFDPLLPPPTLDPSFLCSALVITSRDQSLSLIYRVKKYTELKF